MLLSVSRIQISENLVSATGMRIYGDLYRKCINVSYTKLIDTIQNFHRGYPTLLGFIQRGGVELRLRNLPKLSEWGCE